MLTAEEREMIITALQMRRNFIQTGTVTLSSKDLTNLSVENIKSLGAEIKVLTDSQMEICLKTTKLIDKLTNM